MLCPGWLALCILFLSDSGVTAQEPATGQARQLWARGQDAMRQGKPADAIGYYERCLAADPQFQRLHLSLAAAYIERGDERGAVRHLGPYVAAFPEHHIVRYHYAELLLRQHQVPEAETQFQQFIADIQDNAQLAPQHLIDCHRRLMEIAEAEDDEYSEHLHRGIGLYLLARERAALPNPEEGEMSVEGVLCRAAGELTMARMARRDQARPCWYLYLVWSQLQQRQPALRHLREADSLAPFSFLTPAEKRNLELACLRRTEEGRGTRP